jgi:hypothetical protein
VTAFTRDILNPGWIPTYERELDAVWMEGVRATQYLYLLDRILGFPFSLLGFGEDPFWRLTSVALYESTIHALSRVALDRRRDVMTVQRLRKDLFENIQSEEQRRAFELHLASLRFDQQCDEIGSQIRAVRDQCLAHVNRAAVHGKNSMEALRLALPVADLHTMNDGLCELITALSLDVGRSYHYIEYSPLVQHPSHLDERTDIEKLLDLVASSSSVVRCPEEQPGFWPHLRAELADSELGAINRIRTRLGLPKA